MLRLFKPVVFPPEEIEELLSGGSISSDEAKSLYVDYFSKLEEGSFYQELKRVLDSSGEVLDEEFWLSGRGGPESEPLFSNNAPVKLKVHSADSIVGKDENIALNIFI